MFTPMKTKNLMIAVTISCALALTGVAAQAHGNEEQVKVKDIPASVQKTLKDKAGSQQIQRVEKENRNGKTVYEGIINQNGKEMAITVDENGNFVNQHNESKEEKNGKY